MTIFTGTLQDLTGSQNKDKGGYGIVKIRRPCHKTGDHRGPHRERVNIKGGRGGLGGRFGDISKLVYCCLMKVQTANVVGK